MDRPTKKKLLAACKVNEAIDKGHPHYFDFDREGLELRGQLWRDRVADVIALADEPTSQLVTGLPGSGKSTELKQLARQLEAEGFEVIVADAGEWVRDDEPIETHDILLALVLALYPKGGPDSAGGHLKEYAKRVWTFLNSKADIKQIGLKGDAAEVKVELTTDNTLFQEVSRRLKDAKGVREEVFALLQTAAEESDSPLVIVLDGIEKRATGDLSQGDESEKFRNHWFGAFLRDSRDLRPPVHVVYTIPSFMIRRASELTARFGHEVEFLPMVRVLSSERSNGSVLLNEPGLCAMRDALLRRVPEEHFEGKAVAAWLALHSGGYVRDLLRLVVQCIYDVRPGEKIDKPLADAVIERLRQTYKEGLQVEFERLLEDVHQNLEFPLDQGNKHFMDALLQGCLMFRYHNAKAWYGVHPLLWEELGIVGPTWEDVTGACS